MEERISGIRGFFRINITEDDNGKEKIVGDSGWIENIITNVGVENFLARSFASQTGSLYVRYVSLGSGAAPASDATTLPSEVVISSRRVEVTGNYAFTQRSASNGTATVQWTGTFSSGNSFVTTTYNISNIGLFDSSTGGSLMAGNTYNSSSCASNQNVNVTYQIRMSFA